MTHENSRVCPWWLSFILNNFIRKWGQHPQHILGPFIQPGQTAADIGCGPGFFTLEMARLVGEGGKVIAVDLQEKMLQIVKRRAEKARLSSRIQYRQCGARELGLREACDFILAFYMVHEVPDTLSLLREVKSALKPDGLFLLVEPRMHVNWEQFMKTVQYAQEVGFHKKTDLQIRFSHAILLST